MRSAARVGSQKLNVLANHADKARFVRLYHQMQGARDQVAEAVERLPLEVGGSITRITSCFITPWRRSSVPGGDGNRQRPDSFMTRNANERTISRLRDQIAADDSGDTFIAYDAYAASPRKLDIFRPLPEEMRSPAQNSWLRDVGLEGNKM